MVLKTVKKNNPTAYFLIGHQYTGKSTWIRPLLVSTVDLIPPKYYNLDFFLHRKLKERNLEYNAKNFTMFANDASKEADENFEKWLKDGEDIIIDRTNTTRRGRVRILSKLKSHGYEIMGVVFPVLDDETIQERIKSRPDQVVPFDIVTSFRDRMEEIDDEERQFYNSIYHIRNGRAVKHT